MNKAQAFDHLSASGSHAFLWMHHAREIAAAFGVEISVSSAINDPHGFKGLNVPGVEPGARVEGYASVDLAETIADHLDPSFSNNLMGRGFRFRAAMDAIRPFTVETSQPMNKTERASSMAMKAKSRAVKTTTPHTGFRYPSLRKTLQQLGWKVQEKTWSAESVGGQYIEWWNRGPDVLLVNVDDEDATVFLPGSMARVISATGLMSTRNTRASG